MTDEAGKVERAGIGESGISANVEADAELTRPQPSERLARLLVTFVRSSRQ
jgi:hypothetical protein